MPFTIHPRGVNHFNLVLPDFASSLAHFQQLFDAELLMDLPGDGFHAGVFEIGRVLFEIFSPHQWLMNARYGAHYLGVEYQADMAQVRQAIAARNIRIVRDVGASVHTHPQDTFGISFQFFDGEFLRRTYPLLGGREMRSAEYWLHHHPLGLKGLKYFSAAVWDIDRAVEFMQSFLAGLLLYEQEWTDICARAIGVEIGGSVLELLTPTGAGPLQNHLYRFGDGIRSVVFKVDNLQRTVDYFRSRGVTLAAGDYADTYALPTEENLGLQFGFAQ